MPEIQCEFCGKWFHKKPSGVRKRNFCSPDCYHAAPLAADDKRLQSHTTPVSTRRKIGQANRKYWGIRRCPICNKEYRITGKTHGRKTCGTGVCARALRSINYHGERHHWWRGGTDSHWTRQARRSLDDAGRAPICEHCDTDQEHAVGGLMHIHHVDGDRKNNDPSNLQWLCGSCHSKYHRACEAATRVRAAMKEN